MKQPNPISLLVLAALAFAIALGGCASSPKEADELIKQGRWREGLARLELAMKQKPDDPEPRIQYFLQRDNVFSRVLVAAAAEADAGRFDAADEMYREVLSVEPTNPRASAGLDAVVAARRQQSLVIEAREKLAKGDTLTADLLVKGVLTENPTHASALSLNHDMRERERRSALTPPALKSRMQNPVNLEFRDAPLKLALEAISRSTGISFVFDRDVRPEVKTTIFVKDIRVEDAIDMMLGPNQLEKKILSETAILIYPNTPQKLRENQELMMRAFHLGNADPKQTINLIRTMIKTKDMYVDDRVNLLIMRDTPDAIRLAEKLISMQDLADPEVVLEIEILEVSRSKVRDLGVSFPTQFTGPGGASATLASIKNLTQNTTGVNSGYGIKLLRNDGDTKTLANPRVRVRNREKARVHVGDRVPVISSTLVGTGSGAPVSSEQIQYLDVGIKVEAEPTVHSDDTVAVKINLDVSSLGNQTRTDAGTTAYEVGTRNVTTVLRLRDGETQALMGLIRDDDVKTRSGLPFLGEIPLLDRLFGSVKDDKKSRELVLLITPHIIRGSGQPDATLAEFWSGTEAVMRSRSPFAPTQERPKDEKKPAAPGEPAAAGDAPIGVQSALNLKWGPLPEVHADQEFSVTLTGRSDVKLKGVNLNLRYFPLEFELLGVEDGGYFKRDGAAGAFTPRIEPQHGMVSVTLAAAEGVTATGEGNLVTLRMKPVTTAAKARLEFVSAVGLDAINRQILVSGVDSLDVKIQPQAQPQAQP